MEAIYIRVPVSLKDAIKHRAIDRGETVTQMVRHAISETFPDLPNPPDPKKKSK